MLVTADFKIFIQRDEMVGEGLVEKVDDAHKMKKIDDNNFAYRPLDLKKQERNLIRLLHLSFSTV